MERGAHVSAASGSLSFATRNTMRRTCSPTHCNLRGLGLTPKP